MYLHVYYNYVYMKFPLLEETVTRSGGTKRLIKIRNYRISHYCIGLPLLHDIL